MLRQALGAGGELTLKSLPRGDYRVSVDALGISSSRPIALSGDQDVRLQVISWLDVAIVLLALVSIALALLFIRRPSSAGRRPDRHAAGACRRAPPAAAATRPDPLFAYYYIWFNAGSWNRAKTDYPLLGRYSSDDRGVMEQHVDWAKQAGIDGFIVSWKSTPVLNRRLERLIEVADAEHFKLLVIYQGLDFHREPLPASRVGADLDFFIRRFASDRAFDVFGKPLVIWSGTPRFSRAELARGDASRGATPFTSWPPSATWRATGASPRWSTATPTTGRRSTRAPTRARPRSSRGWERRSTPAAASGSLRRRPASTPERSAAPASSSGATVRRCARSSTPRRRSSPDAIGLISWNEFSENTHIEPSRRHGSRYLRLVGDARGARLPEVRDFDSSEPAATDVSYGVPLLGGTGPVDRRRRGRPHPSTVEKPPIGGLWTQGGPA